MKKIISTVFAAMIGAIGGAAALNKLMSKSTEIKDKNVEKFRGYYNVLNEWMILKQKGKSLENYFLSHDYKTIAIYGVGELGNRLYDELKETSIEIAYAIDKNSSMGLEGVEVVNPDDDLREVDVIVVTTIFAYNEIEELLHAKMTSPIVSLEDVVYEKH